MPKIAAATVAEHRAQVQQRLIDAAEAILRSGQPEKLTAAAVTSEAGIARNSIYRYVDTVDDLLGLVLARHLPAWIAGIETQLATVSDPAERIVVWLRVNLEQAQQTGHGWLMGLARSVRVSQTTEKVMDGAHSAMRDALASAWIEISPDANTARMGAALTRGLLEAGFKQLEQGVELEPLIELSTQAARGLIAAVKG